MKSRTNSLGAKKALYIGIIGIFLSLGFLAPSISAMPQASAAAPAIHTSSVISNGAFNPTPIIVGVDFAPDSSKFDFTVDMDTTNLEFDSVAFVDSTHMRFNFDGAANAGTITIAANSSAFSPASGVSSNILSIVVAVPLINQAITFNPLSPMVVGGKDQAPVVSSTSFMPVEVISNTPSVCTLDFAKVHAVAAGNCSLRASQSGDSVYAPASPVTKNVLVSANPAVKSAEPSPNIVATNLGSAVYDPNSVESGYISVLVASSDQSFENSTLVKIVIPKLATTATTVILISAYSSDAETAAGYFVARIAAVNASGASVREFAKDFEVNLPAPARGAQPYYSNDGLLWEPLTNIDTEVLSPELHSAYFIEADGRIAILSHHFMLFGFRAAQETLTPISAVKKLDIAATTTVKTFGGSGKGELIYKTPNQWICSVTNQGVVSGIGAGTCAVTVTKKASGKYADAQSEAITIEVVDPTKATVKTSKLITAPVNTGFFTHSLTFMITNNAKTLGVGLCSIYANQVALFYLGTKTKGEIWSWKKISTTELDGNGAGIFSITTKLNFGQKVRVLVNGVIQMDSDV